MCDRRQCGRASYVLDGYDLMAGEGRSDLRITGEIDPQKQSADSGQAFKDLPSAAAAFDAVLAKITA